MASIVETSKCEGDELVLLLTHCLPPDLAKLWHTTADILVMLRDGGITSSYTNKKRIGNLLRTQKRIMLEPNEFNKVNWYCFNAKGEFDDPGQQKIALKEKERPQIEPNYFTNLGINFKFIGKNTTRTTTSTNKSAANNNNDSSSSATNKNVSGNNNNTSDAATTNINKSNNESTQQSKTSNPSISTASGFMFSRLDIFEDIVAATEDHRKKCKCKLIVEEKKRFGFEVFTELHCKFCKKSYKIRSGPKPVEAPTTNTPPQQQQEQQQEKKKRGRKPSPLNMTITNAMHASAITVAQMQQLCLEVGCVAPSEQAQHDMMRKRKDAIKEVAEEVIRNNRIEHVRLSKEMYPDHTIKHKDADGNEHNISYGSVCADGAGDKRAYNHIITGSQHCTVVFSLVTGKVLAVKHDQVSCGRCTQRLTYLLAVEEKRSEDITEDDLKHDGECSINSKHGPATAEEFALEHIAEDLLLDPVTKKLRPDEEAILVDWFVADGDTKGAIRFINKQASIIPEFDGKAQYIPDIGHFIKCISNALFKLASQNAELRGVSLLEATRIKAISSDITRIIKKYGTEMKRIKGEFEGGDDLVMKQQLKVLREAAMKRINSIVPHHCNEHATCSQEDCYVIKRRRHYITLHRSMNPQSQLTEEEIVKHHEADISKDHATNGRFKGKHMSMGAKGQAKVQEVVTKRLDLDNIDRVSTASSSNRCENMYSVLSKWTHGKRNYQGRTDSWECNQLYVAITINNDDADEIEDKIRKLTGVHFSPSLREEGKATRKKRKIYHRDNKRKEEVKKRRAAAKIISTRNAVKNSKAPAELRQQGIDQMLRHALSIDCHCMWAELLVVLLMLVIPSVSSAEASFQA